MSRESRFMLASIACALLAAALTFSYAGRAGGERGPTVPVVYLMAPIEASTVLDEKTAATLEVRQVPARLAAPDVVGDPIEVAGTRVLIDLPAGGPLTQSALASGDKGRGAYRLRANERALQIEAVSASEEEIVAGARVDLFASGIAGTEQTRRLIDGAEVLAVDGAAPEKPRLTLRLAAAQVAAVVRADVFARELRAVPIPERDP